MSWPCHLHTAFDATGNMQRKPSWQEASQHTVKVLVQRFEILLQSRDCMKEDASLQHSCIQVIACMAPLRRSPSWRTWIIRNCLVECYSYARLTVEFEHPYATKKLTASASKWIFSNIVLKILSFEPEGPTRSNQSINLWFTLSSKRNKVREGEKENEKHRRDAKMSRCFVSSAAVQMNGWVHRCIGGSKEKSLTEIKHRQPLRRRMITKLFNSNVMPNSKTHFREELISRFVVGDLKAHTTEI